jgi:hypothetical protein
MASVSYRGRTAQVRNGRWASDDPDFAELCERLGQRVDLTQPPMGADNAAARAVATHLKGAPAGTIQ